MTAPSEPTPTPTPTPAPAENEGSPRERMSEDPVSRATPVLAEDEAQDQGRDEGPDEARGDAREGAREEGAPSVLDAPGGLHAALEAILMVTDTPVAAAQLATVLAVPEQEVTAALEDLVADYDGGPRPRGFELRQVGGGWRFYSAPAFAPAVDAFVLDGQTARLTQASLETLAVIAYRQPVSRGRIAAIRGVNVDSVVRTLVTRGLIEEAGQDEDSGAILYRTSSYFLERLGLGSLDDLPPLAPYLPDMDAFDDIDGASR